MKIYQVLLLALLLTPASLGLAKDNPPDIKELNAHRDTYDGQRVVLHGFLVIGPESMYLVKRRGYDKDYWAKDSGCLSLLNTGNLGEKEDLYNGKPVQISGVFRADNSAYGISLSQCGLTGLDINGSPDKNITIETDSHGHGR